MTLKLIDPAADRAREVRRALGKSLRVCLDDSGDKLAGFVIATWDARGEVVTALCTGDGPIGRAMAPAYVSDALNRHIAVLVAEGHGSEPIDGDA